MKGKPLGCPAEENQTAQMFHRDSRDDQEMLSRQLHSTACICIYTCTRAHNICDFDHVVVRDHTYFVSGRKQKFFPSHSAKWCHVLRCIHSYMGHLARIQMHHIE